MLLANLIKCSLGKEKKKKRSYYASAAAGGGKVPGRCGREKDPLWVLLSVPGGQSKTTGVCRAEIAVALSALG